MKIRKRNGIEVEFDFAKIENAIKKANESVAVSERLPEEIIHVIAKGIEAQCEASGGVPTVESVQDMVEIELMTHKAYRLAKNYTTYRYQHELQRKANTTDEKILAIVNRTSAETKEENSNKNPDIVSVQRDYVSGEVSRDMTRRLLLPPDIMKAHDEGMIHFHDSDYFLQHMHNCDLVNLDDMLQNGTVISDTLIEKPHRFSTACNIATQIIAQVASCQYGGQSISLTHLAKFVNVSRLAITKDVRDENEVTGVQMTEEQIQKIVEKRLRKEVRSGIQTIQYQVCRPV